MAEDQEKNLCLLRVFRRCAHLQHHRKCRFPGQGRILILLKQKEKLTQRELMDLTDLRSATLSEQLEKMESAGMILRGRNAEDRRSVDLQLTEKGRQMACEAEQERADTANALFGVLTAAEKEQLSAILEKLYGVWNQDELCREERT